MSKATNFESKQRVNLVYKMLLGSVSRAEIIQYGTDTWGIDDRAIDNIIAKANDIFDAQSDVIREKEFTKALAQLNDLYTKSLKVQDYKTCLSVRKEMSALLGLNAPTQQAVSFKDLDKKTDDELRAIIES